MAFVWCFVKAWLDRWLTEIAVTEKRIKLLSYGDVVVKGKGATFEPLNDVANAIALGNAITAE